MDTDPGMLAREATATRADRLSTSATQKLATSTAANSASTVEVQSSVRPTSFRFDGVLITGDNIDNFAREPVIAFGQPLDSNGHALAGEMWLIVAKDAKGIYYHLTEEPASGTGSYAGYTVKVKGITTYSMLNYGLGEDVPYIGNPDDAFVIATTRLSVSSKFYGGSTQCATLPGVTCKPKVNMIDLGSSVEITNVPVAVSALRESALQLFDPAGNLLDEWSAAMIASGSSSTSCQGFADGVVSTVEAVQDAALGIGQGAEKVLNAFAGGAAGGIAGAGSGAGVGSAAGASMGAAGGVLLGIQLTNDIIDPITSAIGNAAQHVTSPVVSGLAKGTCNLSKLGADLLASLDDIDLGDTQMEDCGARSVCDAFGTQQIGSVATDGETILDDGTTVEEVTVTPVDGQVCTESHIEFSCVTG